MSIACLTACLSLALAPSSLLAPSRGSLHGHVVDGNGAVITNASIVIHPNLRPYSRFHLMGHSDRSGKAIVNLPPGLYDVIVTAPAFAAKAVTVGIRAGEVTNVSIELQIAPKFCEQPQINCDLFPAEPASDR